MNSKQCFSLNLTNKRNMNASIERKLFIRVAGSVKIVIIFSSVILVTRKEINSRVCTLILIKNSMFLLDCSDFWILFIILLLFYEKVAIFH